VSARPALAIDLDAVLGDTRPLWRDWLLSVETVLELEPETLPSDRAEAARELDRRGAGNWRVLLERFGEERAPVYLRREPATSAALRSLAAAGVTIGVYTDAPEPLARIALAQLGADRHVAALETGSAARERLLERLGGSAFAVASRAQLAEIARGVGSDPLETPA
jgi:phosphoglycolate phosphatase-like HAD superfamily hydrolase